jgi:tetratricopeptide (TPR) repeat protein
MGVVFKARQKSLGRVVALKMLRAGEGRSEEERKRFDREARAVACLHHPNIVQIHEVGEAAGQPFLALEFVEGPSLAQRLRGTPWPARQAVTLVESLARAMHYAHGKGVIHRDLKPSNVLLAGAPEASPERYTPKVTDFGLAKRLDASGDTRTGAVVGTPSYMAPEQAEARTAAVGRRTDVYGLGALLYELLTGRPPFQAESPLQTLKQVVEAEPARPGLLNPLVPRDLETVCLKCLEKEPRRRYPSAAAFADDLGRWLRGEPVRARRVSPLGRTWRWCRRKPVIATLIALLALVLAGGFAATGYQLREAEAARREAEASDAQAQQLLNELLPTSPDASHEMGYYQRPPNIDALLKAAAHFESLLRKRPGDTRVRIALTNVQGALGALYDLRGQVAETEACFQRARDLWEALVGQDPPNPVYRDWLATTYEWQRVAAIRQGQVAQALRLELQIFALRQGLAEEQPGNMAVLLKVAAVCSCMLNRREPGRGRDELLRPLEEERALLGRLVGEAPASTALRKRLALTCLTLGEFHLGRRAASEALPCLRQAYDNYRKLAAAQPDDPLVQLHLALCCSRLMGGHFPDPYYAEAVSRFGQAGERLTALSQQHPGTDWLRQRLLETYCSLAVCHWKAGQAALAEHTFRDQVRPLAALESKHPTEWRQSFIALHSLVLAADLLQETKHPAAVAILREAAALAEQYVDTPSRDLEFCQVLAGQLLGISSSLCRAGDPAEALRLAEQARRLYVGLRRAAPDVRPYGNDLSNAWERIAKARWDLGLADEALAAFRESAAVQRQVVTQSPSNREYRVRLSRCYDRLAHWGGLRGDRATVAAALLEQEKLWPDNAEGLMKVSRDFRKLAEAVGQGRERLSPEEQAERRRYLAESDRVRRAAEGLPHGATDGPQR